MADVFDTARYILERSGPMSTIKLQKLCYYAQAWSLVWDDSPLFDEDFEAWANGPICPELFFKTKGTYKVSAEDETGGDGDLSDNQKDTIDRVLEQLCQPQCPMAQSADSSGGSLEPGKRRPVRWCGMLQCDHQRKHGDVLWRSLRESRKETAGKSKWKDVVENGSPRTFPPFLLKVPSGSAKLIFIRQNLSVCPKPKISAGGKQLSF